MGNREPPRLPVSLGGQADFHGTWSGSLQDPHLAGTVKATNLNMEMPPAANREPQTVHLGCSGGDRHVLGHPHCDHSRPIEREPDVHHLQGTLASAGPPPKQAGIPNFDSNSLLHLHVRATKVAADQLLTLMGRNLPVTGQINAQIQADGPIHALDGSGWVELDNGVVYGEPVSRIRAQGKMAGQILQLASITVNDQAGKLSATGSYDLNSRRFPLMPRRSESMWPRSSRLQNAGLSVTGKLGFSVNGSGTLDDPHLKAHATLTDVTISGEPWAVSKSPPIRPIAPSPTT